MDIQIYLLVLLLQIILTFPRFIKTCENLDATSYIIYFSHHAFDVFLFWSPLFLRTRAEFAIHILVAIMTGIHWFYNNNSCIITEILNVRCGYPEMAWLDSIKNMLGLRILSENFHFIWIGLILAYEGWMIVRPKAPT
jgi:hypothetical protein